MIGAGDKRVIDQGEDKIVSGMDARGRNHRGPDRAFGIVELIALHRRRQAKAIAQRSKARPPEGRERRLKRQSRRA